MGIRTDIRFSSYIKEATGTGATAANTYFRAIWHPNHNKFVISGGNGLIYTLDSISDKVQQVFDLVTPADNNIIVIDHRNQSQTIVSDNITIAIDDGSLTSWTTGSASSQNTDILFTLPGDSLLYKISERVSFSDDNYVADETLGITVFDFAGVRVGAQTPSGNRLVVALNDQTGFINAGSDPNILANWNVEDITAFPQQLAQMAVNDAGTLAIIVDDRSDIAFWIPGGADPTLYDPSVNPFSQEFNSVTNAAVNSITYSAFWKGFILIGANGRQGGFISESNPAAGIDSIMNMNAVPFGSFGAREKFPAGATSPTGELIFPSGLGTHQMYMVSPP